MKKKTKKVLKIDEGHNGFSEEYWRKNYSEPLEMDNIGNAADHIDYIRSLFYLEQIEINSIIDLGFGLGYLFEHSLQVFRPYMALGIEPSEFAFRDAKKRIENTTDIKLKLKNCDLVTWAKSQNAKDKIYDLGICTSVFQYLKDEEISYVLPVMAQKMRYLYFSVPTDLEFKRQKIEYDFFDEYAIHRKRDFYLKMISPYFTFVGTRMLESKLHSSEDNTNFRELLFRF